MNKFQDFTKRLSDKIIHRIPEISKKTSIKDQTLREYLKGTLPNARFVKLLCEAIPCSADWLLFGTGPVQRDTSVHESTAEYVAEKTKWDYGELEQRLAAVETMLLKALAENAHLRDLLNKHLTDNKQ